MDAYRSLSARLPFGPMPVQSAAMSTDDRTRRAEARRRARLAARGELPDPEEVEPEPGPQRQRGGLLRRLFPPAPALPGRGDPLAGYTGGGPLAPVTQRLFLLRRNPLAWILPAIVAFVGLMASLSDRENVLGLFGTFVLFGALIAAGWFGWQRPTLYGTAAALLGYFVAVALIFAFFSSRGVGTGAFGGPLEVISGLAVQGLFYAGLGFLGGWYGGYLRRRQVQIGAQQRDRQRRR
jgi:hypothetical protein